MRRLARRSGSLLAVVLGAVVACSEDADGVHGGGTAPDAGADGNGKVGADGAAAEGGVYVEAGPPAVQFIGRFDTRDAESPVCSWPGCRILARFEGTSVSATLREIDESWMDGAPSEWDVAIDDVWTDKIVTTGQKSYALATGLAAGPHKVELYKRSEAQNGTTAFLGFDFGDGTLLSPPPISTRHIEIVGDSAAAGFGVEGIGYPDNDCPGLDYSATWQNFRKAFGPVLATALDAELHGTVYSGKGLVKNIWRPDPDTMPLIFPLSNPTDLAATYDFAWQADVVVVMIGGNDFAEGQPDELGGNGPATATEFTNAYRTFAATLRSKYPNAHLFLSASPSVSDAEPAGRNTRTNIVTATTTVAKERNDDGDAKVYAFAPTVATEAELTACNGHGTPAFHARVASELEAVVKQKTGW